MIVGVLDLQEAVSEHVDMLTKCQVDAKLIKKAADLSGIDGLIIPGGESTVIYKLLAQEQLLEPLRQLIQAGLPVFGTCAGMVLLTQAKAFGALPATVVRNGFDRQKDSFEQAISVVGFDELFHGGSCTVPGSLYFLIKNNPACQCSQIPASLSAPHYSASWRSG